MRWLLFDAYLWGDPDPAGTDALYDFSSTLELEREFIGALWRACGGGPALRFDGARWEQPTDALRRGRLLVLSFGIKTPVTDNTTDIVIMPYATSTTSGVEMSTTVEEVFPDGTSSIAGIILAPPP